jgi:cold shock CspA family protein
MAAGQIGVQLRLPDALSAHRIHDQTPRSRQTARGDGARIEGTVKHWRGQFGFVIGEDGADYFLHSRECIKSGIAFPKLGDRIAFTPERGPKGLRAVDVRYAI